MKKKIFMMAIFAMSMVTLHAARVDTITVDELNALLSKDTLVDLGFSVKWANINIGAKTPLEHGSYFAWGEVEPKDHYSRENSLTYMKNTAELKQMNILDKNGELTAEYDAATKNWGSKYRMPSYEEVDEFFENTKSSEKAVKLEDGTYVLGKLYTSRKNKQSIFLAYPGVHSDGGYKPYDGDAYSNPGTFWTRTNHPMGAADMAVFFQLSRYGAYRHYGLPIRPVMEKTLPDDVEDLWDEFVVKADVLEKKLGKETWVDLGTGIKWMNRNLGAKKVYEYGDFYGWGEVEPNKKLTQEQSKFYGKDVDALLKNKMVQKGDSVFGRRGRVPTYTLLPKYDVVTKKLGKKAKIPTSTQLDTGLCYYCDHKWLIVVLPNGDRMKGMLLRSNDKMLFLPAAGVRYEGAPQFESSRAVLWSSTLQDGFSRSLVNGEDSPLNPYYEVPIRPIMEK